MAPRTLRSAGDLYLRLLAIGLIGYAVLGKGFAYVGAPPVYVGELLFLSGLVVLLRTGCLVAVFTVVPMLLLAALGLWVTLRTVPFIGTYGIDAVRDSVVVMYGGFGLIACALLLEKPARLNDMLRFFTVLAACFGPGAWVLYLLSKIGKGVVPAWPGSAVPLLFIRPGEVAVHVAGSAIFALLMFRRVGAVWMSMLLISIGISSAQSRGGMLAILIPLGLAGLLSGRIRMLATVAGAGILALGIAYFFNLEVEIPSDYRTLSAEQLVRNATSIFENSQDELDGTKMWRLQWWQAIQAYTFDGPYFWSGKGFGIGLAEADGFLVGEEGEAVLRSPHNVNMTMLARAGVPGLVLWVLLLASWLGMMLRAAFQARRRGEDQAGRFLIFLACYLTSILINASFDVALEGPMLGIWFWVLFGVGCGTVMILRARWIAPQRRA